eukprot:8567243-Karenia_brevis.AAC.1
MTLHIRSKCNDEALHNLSVRFGEKGLKFVWAYKDDLHVRELLYSNGVAIVPDRGLDLYRAPSAAGRYCRNSTILYYELDDKQIVKSANVAATVAEEARTILTDG